MTLLVRVAGLVVTWLPPAIIRFRRYLLQKVSVCEGHSRGHGRHISVEQQHIASRSKIIQTCCCILFIYLFTLSWAWTAQIGKLSYQVLGILGQVPIGVVYTSNGGASWRSTRSVRLSQSQSFSYFILSFSGPLWLPESQADGKRIISYEVTGLSVFHF